MLSLRRSVISQAEISTWIWYLSTDVTENAQSKHLFRQRKWLRLLRQIKKSIRGRQTFFFAVVFALTLKASSGSVTDERCNKNTNMWQKGKWKLGRKTTQSNSVVRRALVQPFGSSSQAHCWPHGNTPREAQGTSGLQGSRSLLFSTKHHKRGLPLRCWATLHVGNFFWIALILSARIPTACKRCSLLSHVPIGWWIFLSS